MYTRSELQQLAKKYGVFPRKSKGQNFLVDPTVLEHIVSVAGLLKDDIVLEVGPGFGSLTVFLAQNVSKVYAIEMDNMLIPALSKLQETHSQIEIVHNDVFDVNIPKMIGSSDFKVVANIPYTITSSFIRMMLTAPKKPRSMTLLVQKEVAERIVAQKGEMSLLALSAQAYSEPKISFEVPSTAFWPVPKVDSAVIVFNLRSEKEIRDIFGDFQVEDVMRIARMGFSSKRKTLKNNLSSLISGEKLQKWAQSRDFSPTVRAQELDVADWISLFRVIS